MGTRHGLHGGLLLLLREDVHVHGGVYQALQGIVDGLFGGLGIGRVPIQRGERDLDLVLHVVHRQIDRGG